MHETRWQIFPIVLLGSGILVIWSCAAVVRDQLGAWQYGIYLGGLAALMSAAWLRRRVAFQQRELAAIQAEIATRRAELNAQHREIERVRARAEVELRRQAARIDRREQELARKLIEFHERSEFLQAVNLADEDISDQQLSELVERDRRMIELLEQESKLLFDKIRNNDYSVEGQFQPTLLRDDSYHLIRRVARIYQPDVDEPALQTSIAQVLHAASRACLHFLVVLDRLPVKVKEYNLNTLYGYVRQAVKYYGVYKSASPYFPYVNAAYRLGQVALGSNPVSVGAWWLSWEVGKRGASSLVKRTINRQAILLLHDVVRVIGFEVASIYGGDFRHRDANWIYAAELTELISHFPLTRDSLSKGLQEVGALPLRSEYDRTHLFQLLAEHKSAKPERFRAAVCLTVQERKAVAARLQKFVDAVIEPSSPSQLDRWTSRVQERLGVQVECVDSSAT